jgi:O-antigen/teichoic acid export membrane protein
LAFTNLPRFVAQSIGMVAYPKVASDSGSAGATTLSYALAGVAASGAIVVCLEAAAGRMVPFFFGAEFAGAVPITRVLLLAAAFSSLRRVLNDCARGLGRPDLGARAEVVSWFVLVPLVAALGPELGGLGIAWALAATAITGAGILALLLAWSRRGPVGALSEATT